MSAWMLAVIGLLPPLAVSAVMACRGVMVARLAAVQLATAITALLLILTSFAFDQSSFVDLGLALGLLSLPGALLMAMFVERWL